MALNDPYVSKAEMKAYADITDGYDDTEITRVVSAVSRNIERFCGRQFNDAGTASARVFEPASSCLVRVDDFSTTTGLVVKSDTGNDQSYATTISASTYRQEPANGVVDGQTGHPFRRIVIYTGTPFIVNGNPTVEVTAQWGWTAVPDDVKQATMIQAARIFGRRQSVHGVIGAGDFAFRVSSRMDPDVEDMLAPYRVHVQAA